ncbi:htpX_3, partial [Symbiodinium sp. CCMP2456]
MRFFEEAGMENHVYWVPSDGEGADNTLVYIISHESPEAAAKNWEKFRANAEWKTVAAESEKDGKILAKRPDSVYMQPTDFSPQNFESAEEPRLFELRKYTTAEGRLPALLQRFRDGELKLFEKQGMTNVAYFTPLEMPNTLIYVVAHKDAAAKKKAWDGFRNDEEWQQLWEKSTKVPIEQPGATQHRGEPLGETSSKENWKAPVQRSLRLPSQRAEHFEKCSPLKVPEFPVEGLKILKAFGPPVEKTEPTLAYKIGVIVVAMVMLTLPTIYFTFVGSICYATYWYFAQGQYLLFPGMIGPLPYLVGAGIGSISAVVVFFLLKPVFARPANVARTRSITPQSDPMLFAFVSRVCDVVGSPFPSRIDVTYDVNASASFRLGLRSLLSGNDLVLTIGVPLVGALTTRQFAGVLAHEFGHFSQGTGMRLTFIIRAISEWFARVVFERDEWDKCLDMLCGPDFLPLSVITWPARSCVWLSRQLLRLLMNIGLLVGGFLLREMEFDADRYEARVAGSNEFAETSWRI